MKHVKYTDEQLIELCPKVTSFAGMLRELGVPQTGGMHSHISRRVKASGADISHFTGKGHGRGNWNKKAPEEMFKLNEPGSRRIPGKRLGRALRESGVDHLCTMCGLGTVWQGKPITLEVDHINGKYYDNRKENLRFLCPNCHSQEPTNKSWKNTNQAGVAESVHAAGLNPASKVNNFDRGSTPLPGTTCKVCYLPMHGPYRGDKHSKYNRCMDCDCKINGRSLRCRACNGRKTLTDGESKIDWPTKQEVLDMLEKSNYTQVGKKLGVSDNAVRKFLKR